MSTQLIDGNDPRLFSEMPRAQQIALLAWIHYAVAHATKPSGYTSYSLKHQFEEIGFHIRNGEFKGAMLAAGYSPIDELETNWRYNCRPAYRNRNLHDPNWPAERGRYLLNHLGEEDRKHLNRLVWEAMEQQEQERQQAREESLAAAAAAKSE